MAAPGVARRTKNGENWNRTSEGLRHSIYSRVPLAARASRHYNFQFFSGGHCKDFYDEINKRNELEAIPGEWSALISDASRKSNVKSSE